MIWTGLLAAILILAALPCAALSAPGDAAIDPAFGSATGTVFEPATDMRLAQDVHAATIRIPQGVTIRLAQGVLLKADDELIVEGEIRADARPEGSALRDGISIHLMAGRRIEIRGKIVPGPGLDGLLPGQAGGKGGDVILDAPVSLSSQDLQAGDGGNGGPGADGGDGGSVIVRSGRLFSPHPDLIRSAIGGSGGDGGSGLHGLVSGSGGPGGKGARGGDSIAGTRDDGADGDDGDPGDDAFPDDGPDGLDGGPCMDGTGGLLGFSAFAGSGGTGGVGGNATSPGGDGGWGGDGGDGGYAIGGDGGRGGKGGDCIGCSNAGDGGDGGPGSPAVGGSGGTGGDGGDGFGDAGTGGDAGLGGDGGNAWAGDAGDGGYGGECCEVPGPGRIGGNGGDGGSVSLAEAWGGHGGPGGRGGHGGSIMATGGDGGWGGDGGDARGADGGDGEDGGDGDSPGSEGNGQPGKWAVAFDGAVGGTGGFPDGEGGQDGSAGSTQDGDDGDDGIPGNICADTPEPDENEQSHDDGTWEDAYFWDMDGVVPPDHGAFAQQFSSNLDITGMRLVLTADTPPDGLVMDLFIWEDDGGQPGAVRCLVPAVDPGVVALNGETSEHVFLFQCPGETLTFWAGYWGNWPGAPAGWKIAADLDGPGGGNPMTKVAPGQAFPEGWQSVSEVFGPTAALGISVRFDPHGVCCLPDGCCRILVRSECEAMGGVWMGAGTVCDPSPCNPGLPDFADHDIGNCVLTVTDQGILGFMDATQAEGSGFVFPAGGSNHLYVGGLWVGTDPGYVAGRDYDADPDPEWAVTSCPAGEVVDAPGGLGDQGLRSVYEDKPELQASRNLVVTQRSAARVPGPEGDFVIIRYQIGNRGDTDLPQVFAGLFCDFDMNGQGSDDTGLADPGLGTAFLTDVSGIHAGLRLLQSGPPEMPVYATLVDNPTFVYPNQFISDEDKFAFLAAADPEHILLDGSDPLDYSALVSTGPFPLAAGEVREIAFAVIGGGSLEGFLVSGEQAQLIYQSLAADAPEADRPAAETLRNGIYLYPPAPNPTGRAATVRFALEEAREVRLEVFDVAGRRIQLLAEKRFGPGAHALEWNGDDQSGRSASAGIYFLRLSDETGEVQVRRISVVR